MAAEVLCVAVAGHGGLAADLPSGKAAPRQLGLAICNINGVAGFVMPGSTPA